MNEVRSERVQSAVVFGVLLVLGLALGGWILGSEIKDVKLGDRYVTVRGLTERQVKADLAVWNLSSKESGDDLAQVYSMSNRDKAVTMKFLTDQGIAPGDIASGAASAIDRETNEYGGDRKGPRYIVTQSISVVSKNVDGVAGAAQKASALVQQGVILTGESKVAYSYTALNSIKPDMISEATKNARAAADRFAADSGSQVGAIRRAEQGVFSITGASGQSAAQDEGEGAGSGGESGSSDIMKKVRVVTTVDYYLNK